jgi:P27 family predicted phage terminase small subunit
MGRIKPTALKILEGNRGRRPLNAREPKPKPGAPVCPSWLADEAKAEWRRVVPELRRLGLVAVIDRAVLAAYCCSYADLKEAVETIQREGRTLVTTNGNTIQHPAVGQKNKAMVFLKAFSAEFGFSPASRVKIEVPVPKEEKSTWEGLLA